MTQPRKKSSKAPANVTSHDVAKAAGVSQSVVSRAFSATGKIAPETRKRVLGVARDLGYHPNAFARSLVQQRTRIIGVLIARLDNHFYPKVLDAFTAQLWATGRQVMYFNVDDGEDIDKVLRTALQYRVEAMVVASITLSSHMAEVFCDAGIPVVLFNRYLDDPDVYAVSCDNVAGGRMVADAFLDAGHTRFAFIGGHPDTSTNHDRKGGFMTRLKERGAALSYALEKDYSYDWGKNAARHLFSQKGSPDALFCASDLIALGALDTARAECGLRVPEDVAIVGFDDIEAASWQSYALTTVRQPVDLMLAETLAVILHRDAQPKRVTVPVTFVERGTTRQRVPSGEVVTL